MVRIHAIFLQRVVHVAIHGIDTIEATISATLQHVRMLTERGFFV